MWLTTFNNLSFSLISSSDELCASCSVKLEIYSMEKKVDKVFDSGRRKNALYFLVSRYLFRQMKLRMNKIDKIVCIRNKRVPKKHNNYLYLYTFLGKFSLVAVRVNLLTFLFVFGFV